MIEITIEELCRRFGQPWLVMYGLVQLLRISGLAQRIGYEKGKRGRPKIRYSVPSKVVFSMETGDISDGGVKDAA